MKHIQQVLMFAAAALAGAGCGDDLQAPGSGAGSLEISVSTSGSEPDADGYTVSIDDAAGLALAANATLRQDELEPGPHQVRLDGLAANCSVTGGNPQSVTIESGATATVNFQVSCSATAGSLQVTVATGGSSPDPDGYAVTVDGADRGIIAASGTLAVDGLPAGEHAVGLAGIAGNCVIQGDNPRAVTVPADGSVSAEFVVNCTPPPAVTGSIRVTTSTTGAGSDPNGYAFLIDGGSRQPIGVNATATVTNVAAGTRTVTLSNVAEGCTLQGSNRRSVEVTAGATAELTFSVTCSAVTQTLTVTTVTTGSNPDPDGYTVSVDGGTAQPIGVNGTLSLTGATVGSHTVTLAGLAANCAAEGENPRTVQVTANVPAAVEFRVACSPGGGTSGNTIAFHSFREGASDVFTMNLDGSAPVNRTASLPNDLVGYSFPAWSLDGSRLAFTGGLDHHLYVMNADGSGLRDLTPNSSHFAPVWSPDGRTLLTSSTTVALVNADGSGERFLADGACAVWSPDGTRIAFGRGDGIFIISPDGSGETRVTQAAANESDCEPEWSPDGSRITFIRRDAEDMNGMYLSNLWIVNADGSNPRQLTNFLFRGEGGTTAGHAWSPDGTRLVLAGQVSGGQDLLLLDPAGGEPVNLTNDHMSLESRPAWSPDGRRILFDSQPRDPDTLIGGPADVFVIDSDGRNPTNLTNHPARDRAGVWQP